jgi:signal transduction histidine kinase
MTLITSSALVLQERDPSQVTPKLQQLQDLAHDALGEMRTLIHQLRPLSIAEQGLEAVLKEHLNELKSRNNLDVSLTVPKARLPIEPRQQQELFRIIQEALNNICKHALVNQAAVTFEVDPGFVTVTIQDHGVGFDPARNDNGSLHFGLSSMRERTQELGGTLDVVANPGEGTRITIRIPILEKE